MSFVSYTGLTSPNAVLEKMSEFALASGWTILENCTDDLAIDESGTYDGKRLVIKNADSSVFGSFRTANGKKIFESQEETTYTSGGVTKNTDYGIGLIGHTAYTANPSSGLWFDQPEVTRHLSTGEAIGVGVAMNPDAEYTLYCNCVTSPADMLIFSLYDGNIFQHLAIGNLEKVGNWDGGLIISASRNSYYMFTKSTTYAVSAMEQECAPIFSSTQYASTFLRIDVDAAPDRAPSIGGILWASSGSTASGIQYGYTGKQLALPVFTSEVEGSTWGAKIPNYRKLQSQNSTDTGINVNTLNCITMNMNLAAYVVRDPDSLRNLSPVGYISGCYFISLRNVAPADCYEISYPQSGSLHQVFPYTRRRGVYGMDGFSVVQEESEQNEEEEQEENVGE